jgi:hypothetical protein
MIFGLMVCPMNTNMNNPNPIDSGSAVDPAIMERDVLISRIIDGEGSGPAWERFAAIAGSDASAWRELAVAQRQHSHLVATVRREIAIANEIELPATGAARGRSRSTVHAARAAKKWTGWAVAAVITLMWGGAMLTNIGSPGSPNKTNIAGISGSWRPETTQDAINAYLEVGQKTGNVIGEVPNRVMIESRPNPNGNGVEVVYIRQFMERAVVPHLYRTGSDESGYPTVLPASEQTKPGGKL